MSYARDRSWSDAYIPALRGIVGPLLLDEAPLEHDTKQSTDLIVLMARDMRIGCRVRRPGYADRYPWQFTIRSTRDSGAVTEITKIIDGWGDWFVYGHADDNQLPTISRWFVLDLGVFRASLIRRSELRPTNDLEMSNRDGTHFIPYDVRVFPRTLVVATSHVVPEERKTV